MVPASLDARLTPVVASPLPVARRVLVFAPHADDEVFGCGGTLHRYRQAGVPVKVVVTTNGELGGELERQALSATREAESRAAAKVLGYDEPVFWSLPDFGMRYGEALVQRIVNAVDSIDPDVVFAPAPTELHPDHQALSLASAEAVRRLGGERRIAFYEVSAPLVPNLLIDITSAEELKRQAMRCFPSQLQQQSYDEHIAALNRYRSYTLGNGVRAAEAFFVASASELASGAVSLFEAPLVHRRRLGLAVEPVDVPLVSVIVRSMQRPTLTEALASLAAQTYPNIEALIVNAKGGEHPVLPDYSQRLVTRVIDMGVPLKRSAAANAGLDAARGQFVAFLDDDDTLDPDHFAQLIAMLRKEGDSTIGYAGVRCADRADPQGEPMRVFGEAFENRAKLLAGNFIPSHAVLFPRRLIEDGTRFDEKLDVYEDWDFWLQLAEKARFVYLDRVSATYFTGGNSEVSPLAFDPEAVRTAARALFDKWKSRVSPDELKGMGDLYHRTKLAHLSAQEEITRLVDRVHETEERVEETKAQVAAVKARLASTQAELVSTRADLDETVASMHRLYASTSWRVTLPLRYIGAYARNVAALWRAGSVAASRAGWGHLAERAITVGRQDGMSGVKALVDGRLGRAPESPDESTQSVLATPQDRVLPPASGKREILFVSHEASRTGAPIFLLKMIRHLTRDLDVGCTILLVSGGELERDFRALGPTVVLDGPEGLDAVLFEALKQRNIAFAYVNTISNGELQARLKGLGCPVVCHVHELAFSIEHHFGGRNLRQVLANTDLFLACSGAIRAYLQNVAPAIPVELAYPFIDVAAYARAASEGARPVDVPDGTIVVGGSGVIGWRKGTDLFVQVAKHVLALTAKPVMFVWLGGPRASGEYPRLKYEAEVLGIDKHLVFPGQVDAPARYFTQFDIFALPSREDPFPLVMLEAGSLGKPIVCFDNAGGTPEVVEDDAGFVVPYLDIEAMAKAVVRLAEDPELRARLGENARRKIVDRYDIQVGAARITGVLKPFLLQRAASS
jgi:LmbE family N-acetylglucosaminyl deacetylase/glycosyltransferase involved in cell wall biosynthesis/GT2 family glycosyltransferase